MAPRDSLALIPVIIAPSTGAVSFSPDVGVSKPPPRDNGTQPAHPFGEVGAPSHSPWTSLGAQSRRAFQRKSLTDPVPSTQMHARPCRTTPPVQAGHGLENIRPKDLAARGPRSQSARFRGPPRRGTRVQDPRPRAPHATPARRGFPSPRSTKSPHPATPPILQARNRRAHGSCLIGGKWCELSDRASSHLSNPCHRKRSWTTLAQGRNKRSRLRRKAAENTLSKGPPGAKDEKVPRTRPKILPTAVAEPHRRTRRTNSAFREVPVDMVKLYRDVHHHRTSRNIANMFSR